ncbi:MAG: LysR family transcriptional regulator [Sphingomonadales bacterium]|jgi:DNA-binding transcriptional LysR family regulator|nr:LysR family transcriptional regulator [Sphingomonadales bacterium]
MIKRGHLRQFLALVDQGSFTAAARQLRVTQPTLSAGIADLERQLGTALVLRERRAIRLTEAGVRLLAHARSIERDFHLAESVARLGATPPAPLRLGVLASVSTDRIAAFAAHYADARPLELTEGSDADLRRRLADHRLDAAFTLLRDGEMQEAVLEEGYAMLVSDRHRLAARADLVPDDVASEIMIARRSCEILAETSRFFTAHGVRPFFLFRAHNDDRCLALVRSGAGVTTAPVSLATPGVVAIPLKGYDFRRRLGLVWRDDNARTAAPPQLDVAISAAFA